MDIIVVHCAPPQMEKRRGKKKTTAAGKQHTETSATATSK
jgi:hypothetical protein